MSPAISKKGQSVNQHAARNIKETPINTWQARRISQSARTAITVGLNRAAPSKTWYPYNIAAISTPYSQNRSLSCEGFETIAHQYLLQYAENSWHNMLQRHNVSYSTVTCLRVVQGCLKHCSTRRRQTNRNLRTAFKQFDKTQNNKRYWLVQIPTPLSVSHGIPPGPTLTARLFHKPTGCECRTRSVCVCWKISRPIISLHVFSAGFR